MTARPCKPLAPVWPHHVVTIRREPRVLSNACDRGDLGNPHLREWNAPVARYEALGRTRLVGCSNEIDFRAAGLRTHDRDSGDYGVDVVVLQNPSQFIDVVVVDDNDRRCLILDFWGLRERYLSAH